MLRPILTAALYFFCVLTSLMVLRPARDAIGMEGGLDSIRWLFIGTAGTFSVEATLDLGPAPVP